MGCVPFSNGEIQGPASGALEGWNGQSFHWSHNWSERYERAGTLQTAVDMENAKKSHLSFQ